MTKLKINTSFMQIMLLATVILMDILGGAELDIIVPSFPELKAQFGLSPFLVETLLSVNFIGYCISLFFVGSFADYYGRKPIALLGVAIFIIGTISCLWGASYKFLLLGRLLQGIGVAAPATICFLVVADAYSLKDQQYLMAILNGIMNIVVGLAPVIGSYISLYFHWQGNFMALLFLALILVAMIIFFLPNKNLARDNNIPSWRGYISIFKSKNLRLMILCFTFLFAPYWIFLGMSSILYIESLNVSLAHFGYYQGGWALIFAFGSIISGSIIKKFPQKIILEISAYLCVIGLISVIYITVIDCKNPLIIALAFLPYSIGTIIPCVILYPICLDLMPEAKGRLTALTQATKLILVALSLELAGYFYQGSFRNIGIIISFVILVAVISLFMTIRNSEIVK